MSAPTECGVCDSEIRGDCQVSSALLYRNDMEFGCGNLSRTADRKTINVSFRTSPQTGVGISFVIVTTFFY